MPMYEYRCQDCATVFVQRRPFSDSNGPADCPECASGNTQKVLTAATFISQPASGIPVPMANGGGCGCGGACACQS